jgi:small subunit ribosomal protein S7
VLPDPVYNSTLLAKFVNNLMKNGKKSTAQRIIYGALDIIQQRTNEDPLKVFKKGLDRIKPALEVKSRRVGGATYQVPIEVSPRRQLSLALRWLIDYASKRGEKTMKDKLAGEILDASNGRGSAVKKKDDTHRMAEANKAFAHYRW